MHPIEQRDCDEILAHPLLQTPPPEPEVPPPPRIRRPRVFKFPPRFPLISEQFYIIWTNHLKELMLARHKVNDKPPALFPELYLKPRRLDHFAKLIEENMKVNKDLLKRINLIQRTGGYVDCWNSAGSAKMNKLMCNKRQRDVNEIERRNVHIYRRLLTAKSEQPSCKELNIMWESTKRKLMLGAALPFILFRQEKLDRDITDPAMDKPPHVTRQYVKLEVEVVGGCKIGVVLVELFTDITPETCNLFLSLIRGDPRGYAYAGTRVFSVIPGLYCRCGDVAKDCGFGAYMADGLIDPPEPENFILNHTIPGVLSMAVTNGNEMTGQFNIIFKPLQQFDGKHVVFGRIKSGPAQFLERISAMGLKLGTTSADIVIKSCGWYTVKYNIYHEGSPNTIKFPPRKKK